MLVVEKTFDAGVDVSIGADPSAGLVIAGWIGPTLLLISARDQRVHLQPGMRLVMCDEDGSDRVVGTFEELSARGVTTPIPITTKRRINISVRPEISVFAHYLPDDSPE